MDPARPRAEAVAVRGNRILAVGTNADVREAKGPHTRVIDAAGASVLPGFIESHMHVFPGGSTLTSLQLDGVHGMERLADVARAWAATHPDDRLIYGVQASYQILDNRPRASFSIRSCPTGRSGSTPSTAIRSGPTPRRWSWRGCCMARSCCPATRSSWAPTASRRASCASPAPTACSWRSCLRAGARSWASPPAATPIPRPRPPSGPPTEPPSPAACNGARGTASPRSTTWTATPTSSSFCASWTMPASLPAASACRST